MGQQKANPSRVRWLIPTVILAIAVVGVAIAFWAGVFSPKKVEKIYFSSCQWSEDGVNLFIANTGADELIINKVWINSTLLDSTEWESFPSMRFQPRDQGVLCITPLEPLTIFVEGTPYQFTIETVSGNSFSHTAIPEPSNFIFMKTESVEWPTSVTWLGTTGNTNNMIVLTLRNTGTTDIYLSICKINNVQKSLNTTTPYKLSPSSTVMLTIQNVGWSQGYNYEIRFIATSGTEFAKTYYAGTTGGAGVILNKDNVSWNTGSITIYVRNTGTSDAEIDAVYMGTSSTNLVKQTSVTYNPTSKIVYADGGTITITVTYSWSTDTTYYFKIAPKVGAPLEFNAKSPSS